MVMENKVSEAFLRLVSILDELRVKCPWDREQTIKSLRPMTLEESYELADSIMEENWNGIREELGDLLLHVLFYAKIGAEQKQFTLEEVITGICNKLIARHPHVYGDVQVNNEEEVKKNWENLKLKEGKKSVIGGVPQSLPSMIKAMRLQEKVKQVGFEWENKDQVWEKVQEEILELQSAVASGSRSEAEEELGDVFFSLVNYARFLHLDADLALERTNKKFISRFTRMEQQALLSGKDLNTMTLQEMDAIWNKIKQQKQN